MIAILWLICGGFPIVSSSDDIIEMAVGHNISLIPKYIGDSSGVSWWFKGRILADIRLGDSNPVYFYPKFDLFKDRTTINGSTGHMTIRNLTEEDSGHYRAEGDNTRQVTRIRIIVFDHPVRVVKQSSGCSVILTPKYSGTPSEVSWWRGPHILARAQLHPSSEVAYYGLGGRAHIDPSTGNLTIRCLIMADAAEYRAEVLVNNTIQYTAVKLTVIAQEVRGRRGTIGLSGCAIAVMVVAASVILVAILGVLSCKCGAMVTRFRDPPVVLVSMRCITKMALGTRMEKTETWYCDCRLCQSSFPMERFQEKTHCMEVTNYPATIPHVSVNDNNGHFSRVKD
ncbi:uncharacterized protein LOC120928127 isoform X2 [Rana temporaria]|nr:uncharacterized protein LOC120928127 isoform X2 [Rana temporaria]